MKFNVFQKDFYQGIQVVQRAVSSNNMLPILNGILIKAEPGHLKLVANNLEIGIEYSISAEVIVTGEIVLPANHLLGIIRELPPSAVEVECDLATNSAEIVCEDSRFQINGYSAEDFPLLIKMDDGVQLAVSSSALHEMIEQVKIATSTDETQPFLNGAVLKFNGAELMMASTNSYRLAQKIIKLDSEQAESVEVIIPNRTLGDIGRLVEEDSKKPVGIQISSNQIIFQMDNLVVTSRLIEGRFPHIEPFIPKNFNTRIRVDRKKLLQAGRRVFLIAAANHNLVNSYIANGRLILESINSEIGQAHEELSVFMEGEELEITFNISYLLDVLKVSDCEQVDVNFTGKMRPFVVKFVDDEFYLYVVGPSRQSV